MIDSKKSDKLLILFVKNLIPGQVKTRLAKDIGIFGAIDVYQYLVEHCHDVVEELEGIDKCIYYSQYVEMEDIWDAGDYQMNIQKGEGLGERMKNAFEKSFTQKYEKVVIMGTDCVEINDSHINEAFESLETNEVVLGPASDGGYYLIGMTRLLPELFEQKDYSHENVLNEALSEIAKKDVNFHLLPQLNDIDTFEDLKNSPIEFEFVSPDEDE